MLAPLTMAEPLLNLLEIVYQRQLWSVLTFNISTTIRYHPCILWGSSAAHYRAVDAQMRNSLELVHGHFILYSIHFMYIQYLFMSCIFFRKLIVSCTVINCLAAKVICCVQLRYSIKAPFKYHVYSLMHSVQLGFIEHLKDVPDWGHE